MNRCVVTGCGAVSAIGNTLTETLVSLRNGRCGIAPFEISGRERQPVKVAAAVRDFDAGEHFSATEVALMDRFVQLAVVAARDALTDAEIELPREDIRIGVVIGSGIGGKTSDDEASERLYAGNGRVHPLTIPRVMLSSVASHVSTFLGVVGPTFATSSACSSAAHAIGLGAMMIRQGLVDVIVAGGAEAPLCFGLLCAWESMRILDPKTCRPFSRDRRGLIVGEGAGVVVLEAETHAEKRGARAYAELAGVGFSADAHHITMPTVEGPARAMSAAITDAGLEPKDIDYINAHGTGTQANDATETRAIHQVFGDVSNNVRVSSTKSAHGHLLGASAAVELIATLLGMRHGFIPATLNYTEPDPACDLNLVTNHAVEAHPRVALSNAFAFGGLNACLVVRAIT
jgi:nodulation protein E